MVRVVAVKMKRPHAPKHPCVNAVGYFYFQSSKRVFRAKTTSSDRANQFSAYHAHEWFIRDVAMRF